MSVGGGGRGRTALGDLPVLIAGLGGQVVSCGAGVGVGVGDGGMGRMAKVCVGDIMVREGEEGRDARLCVRFEVALILSLLGLLGLCAAVPFFAH